MNLPDSNIDSIDVSRRQLLLSSGSFVAGASALAWAGSSPAAAVEAGQIDIPPTQVETPDGEVESVQATVGGSYQYSTNGADGVRFELRVAPPEGEFAAIDSVAYDVQAASGSGQYTLSGSVLDHPDIGVGVFDTKFN